VQQHLWQWCITSCLPITHIISTWLTRSASRPSSQQPCQHPTNLWHWYCCHHCPHSSSLLHYTNSDSALTVHPWTTMQPHIPSMAHFNITKTNKKSSFHIFSNGCPFLLDNHIIPLPYHLIYLFLNFSHTTCLSHALIPCYHCCYSSFNSTFMGILRTDYATTVILDFQNYARTICQPHRTLMTALWLAHLPWPYELCLNPKNGM